MSKASYFRFADLPVELRRSICTFYFQGDIFKLQHNSTLRRFIKHESTRPDETPNSRFPPLLHVDRQTRGESYEIFLKTTVFMFILTFSRSGFRICDGFSEDHCFREYPKAFNRLIQGHGKHLLRHVTRLDIRLVPFSVDDYWQIHADEYLRDFAVLHSIDVPLQAIRFYCTTKADPREMKFDPCFITQRLLELAYELSANSTLCQYDVRKASIKKFQKELDSSHEGSQGVVLREHPVNYPDEEFYCNECMADVDAHGSNLH